MANLKLTFMWSKFGSRFFLTPFPPDYLIYVSQFKYIPFLGHLCSHVRPMLFTTYYSHT